MSGNPKLLNLTPMRALLDELRLPAHLLHLAVRLPILLRHKIGHGEPIYVIPGYLTSDRSTFILRKFLSWHGYTVYGWGLGVNRGGAVHLVSKIADRLKVIVAQHGQKITLIGWSLGGFLAREVARDFPQLVNQVVTLGSPLRVRPRQTVFDRNESLHEPVQVRRRAMMRQREKTPIAIPLTSIYSKSDRVVAWQASRDEDLRHQVNHIEVNSSHGGLGIHPDVYQAILAALAKKS